MTNEPSLKELGLHCTGDHKHEQLKGTTRVNIGGKRVYTNKTKLAGAYPPRLCRQWAQVLRKIGPRGSKGTLGIHEQHDFEQLLKEANSSADRQTPEYADAPDHPNWQGEASCDPGVLREAQSFIREHPVVFGQFSKAEIEKEHASKNHRSQE